MNTPNDADLTRFETMLKNFHDDEDGHLVMPATFNGSQTFRMQHLYWFYTYGSWPGGTLKKGCTVAGCVSHYIEKGHILTKEDMEQIRDAKDYWGLNTALANKYGVSKARISQIRGTR